ncbi:helix-hairpin-helix domain-containing protein [Nannocystis sp. SCPEA4]|uniref:helix-hairpin-helix domain-containing protein n=1 Tax=Nannocystis sp. SCPEA4 TaxID=2996787 RepID=UPI00226F2602|nr:helix-hairpin-helix domain-containing protein [Nannocystis sp. SCPEA4]MCY1056649.1 helix-hairpin-helix domain-containing protein [Nannocystis sp. SCPEA4]
MARAAAKSHVRADSSDRAANTRVAAVFAEIADLLEVEGQNPFRIRAYRNAAHELGALGRDLAAMVAAGDDLTELPGVGEDLAGKICEVVETGSCAALDELHATWPASIHEVMRVPGVGPKRARTLFEQLAVRTLADLHAAATKQQIRELPGFGATSERNILDALAGLLGTGRRLPLAEARVHGERLLARLRGASGVIEAVIAGSYRRALATVGDLDFLVTARAKNGAIAALVGAPEVAHVLAEGDTRATVVLRSGLQVDLRVVGRDSFGAALHYFTGSKAHNIAVRRLGVARGLKINEYGVFRDERRVAGRTEESVFAAVGLPFIPPELRENRGEIAAARAGELPQLVTSADLRGDLVLVPAKSEPSGLVTAAAVAAKARGLAYLLVVHEVPARSHAVVDWAARIHAAAEACAERGLAALQGLELDMSLKTCPEVAVEFVAARLSHVPHAPAHPALLRLVGPTRASDEGPDPTPLVRAAIGAALAVVGEPAQLPRLEPQLRAARAEGVAVVLGSGGEPGGGEASRLDLAVSQARRAWIDAGLVVNSRPLAEVRAVLARRSASRRRAGP